MEVLQAIGWFLSSSWDFFTEIKVPGFDFSFAALLVGLFLAGLSPVSYTHLDVYKRQV